MSTFLHYKFDGITGYVVTFGVLSSRFDVNVIHRSVICVLNDSVAKGKSEEFFTLVIFVKLGVVWMILSCFVESFLVGFCFELGEDLVFLDFSIFGEKVKG